MTDSELLFELIKRPSYYDNSDKFELMLLLWKDIIKCQDWGYGCDNKIEWSLHKKLEELAALITNT